MPEQVIWTDLGLIRYADALQLQQQKLEQLTQNKLNGISNTDAHYLFLCEHEPVITLGKSGDVQHLLTDEDFLREKGIEFYPTNRGGDITYHGPGQLVGYPVLDLELFFTDIKKYMRLLEEVIIQTIAEYGLKGYRIEDATGVWVDGTDGQVKKIAAFGVKMSRWVTMHGFALNIDNDLSYFNYIVPCGISDKGVTSMKLEVQSTKFAMPAGRQEVRPEDVKRIVLKKFAEVFNVELIALNLITNNS